MEEQTTASRSEVRRRTQLVCSGQRSGAVEAHLGVSSVHLMSRLLQGLKRIGGIGGEK